jgi:hypothetical protein
VTDETWTYIFKEYFQDATGLFVDKTRDTFDTTTAGQTTNGGLCNAWGDKVSPWLVAKTE